MKHRKEHFAGIDYFQIGCSKCNRGDRFIICFDGKKEFLLVCDSCGNKSNVYPPLVKTKPEPKAYDARFFQ